MTPLTMVNGPVNARICVIGSVRITAVLCNSRPVRRPSSSVSRFRSETNSGTSYAPPGSRRASSSASRIRYMPDRPAITFHRVTAMAWSW